MLNYSTSYKTPHTCPVCLGRGEMPPGFYSNSADVRFPETCKKCKGNRIIWEEEHIPYARRDDEF